MGYTPAIEYRRVHIVAGPGQNIGDFIARALDIAKTHGCEVVAEFNQEQHLLSPADELDATLRRVAPALFRRED